MRMNRIVWVSQLPFFVVYEDGGRVFETGFNGHFKESKLSAEDWEK